jgi:hypothetical protein
MKPHEIQCHFREVPRAISEYRLRPRPRTRPRMLIEYSPHELPFFENEHEDE